MRKLKLQELNRVDNDTFKKQPKTPLALVLDNIRSGLNVGSAFRTSDGFGLEKIYLCGITATPPHKEILKTAIERLQGKITYEPIGFELLPENFTLTQIQNLYQSILDGAIDKRKTRKKLLPISTFIMPR